MTQKNMMVVLEIHVDDEQLSNNTASYHQAKELVLELAETFFDKKIPASWRFRETFAGPSAALGNLSPLRLLTKMGQEVGTHAHGVRIKEAKASVDANNVENRVISPGMVQLQKNYGKLFNEVAKLGFKCITDSPPHNCYSYGGFLPWTPGSEYSPNSKPLGIIALENSIDPFEWGLLTKTDNQIIHARGLTQEHFIKLRKKIEFFKTRVLPEQQKPVFLFTIHEHNLSKPGILRLDPDSVKNLIDSLEGFEVVPSLKAALEYKETPIINHKKTSKAISFAQKVIWTGLSPSINRNKPKIEIKDKRRIINTRWEGPKDPKGILLISHAGKQGGTNVFTSPFGFEVKNITSMGFAVVAFDRSGTGLTKFEQGSNTNLAPGNTAHVNDLAIVYEYLSKKAPIGIMSFSSGLIPVLRAAKPYLFVIDCEAPADRWSLIPPISADAPKNLSKDLEQDLIWIDKEPIKLLNHIKCPYHRIQGEYDHVHGRMFTHAQIMAEKAFKLGLPTLLNGSTIKDNPKPLPGRIHAHGPQIADWILELFFRTLGS